MCKICIYHSWWVECEGEEMNEEVDMSRWQNADLSMGHRQILFLINPHNFTVEFHLPHLEIAEFSLLADTLRFSTTTHAPHNLSRNFHLEPISCYIFVRD